MRTREAITAGVGNRQPILSLRGRSGWLGRGLPLLLLLPLAVFALAPLVRGPLFASADGLTHVYQLVEFDRGIRSGVLYPRWAPDPLAGYGYPIFLFAAPLMFYLAEGLHLVGLGFADALKAVVAVGMIGSVGGMYVLGRELWGRWGGFIAAAAYLYAPYRIVNTYLDGEIAQTLAWAWLPWLVWACWRWLRTETRASHIGYGVLAALLYAGLLYTHSVMAWLATLLLALAFAGLLVLRQARLSRLVGLAGFMIAGAGLAAPYWLPALAERGFVQLDRVRNAGYDFHTNLLRLNHTLSLDLAHNYAGYIDVNGPAQLGLIQTAVAALAVVALTGSFVRKRGQARALLAVVVVFGGLAAIFFVLMLRPAAVYWDHFPFGAYLQFPDRMLAPLALCLAILAGGIGVVLERLPRPVAAVCALGLAGCLAYGATGRLNPGYVALPASIGASNVVEYEQLSGAIGTTAKGEFTPVWMGSPPLASPLTASYLAGAPPTQPPEQINFRLDPTAPTVLKVPQAFYPAWRATVNGRVAAVKPSPEGLIQLDLPAGPADVRLSFGETWDRLLADALALLSLLALVGVWLRQRRWMKRMEGSASPGPAAATVVAGGVVLLLALLFTPGRLQLAGWPAPRPMLIAYDGGLNLIGSGIQVQRDGLRVAVRLAAQRAVIPPGLSMGVRLMSHDSVWASASQPLPDRAWTAGQARSFDFVLPLAGGTPAGTYSLNFQLTRPDGSDLPHQPARLTFGAPLVQAVSLGPVTLPARSDGAVPESAPAHPDFGPLGLAAWQPPANAEQGGYVPINLWWQAPSKPAGDWTISVRVIDGQGRVWASHDDKPRAGYNPTSLWAPGRLERDVQMVLLPEGIPPGDYSVQASWYSKLGPVGPQGVSIGTFHIGPASKPDLRKLAIAHVLAHQFPQGIELLGYDVPQPRVQAGNDISLRLFWRAVRQPAADYPLSVEMAGTSVSAPLPAASQWRAGELIETRVRIPTDARNPQPDSRSQAERREHISVVFGDQRVELPEEIRIEPVKRLTELPAGIRQASPNILGGKAALAGYQIAHDGSHLRVTLYWQALAPLPPDLHVFVHVLDAQNRVVAQHDGVPGSGKRPTASWTAGEFVEDVHDLALPPGAPAGLQPEVGLYDPATGERLGNRLLLQPLP